MGEADEEAAESGDEDFEEGGAETVLLKEGAEEAVVDLFVEWGAAGSDAAAEGEGFGNFIIGGAGWREGGSGGKPRGFGKVRSLSKGADGAGIAFTAESSRPLTMFPIVDEGPDARITRGFVQMALAGNDVHDRVCRVSGAREVES